MSILTNKGVTSGAYQKNVEKYINCDTAILRDYQNLHRFEGWEKKMWREREMFGHNTVSRQGAKNTVLYHQILAFNPDDCDLNGGGITPEKCMEIAKDCIGNYYKSHQAVFVLHKESCESSGSDRYAVHIAINRSDPDTGIRYDIGTSKKIKAEMARRGREIGKRWDLKEVVPGEPNSVSHPRQPSRVEKEIIARGKEQGLAPEDASYRAYLISSALVAKNRSVSFENMKEYLGKHGIKIEERNGRYYARDAENPKYEFNLAKLSPALTPQKLNAAFGMVQIAKDLKSEKMSAARIAELTEKYTAKVESTYREYAKAARAAEGTPLTKFPEYLLPQMPIELKDNPDLISDSLRRKLDADSLRAKYACKKGLVEDVSPLARRSGSSGDEGSRAQSHGGEKGTGKDRRDR